MWQSITIGSDMMALICQSVLEHMLDDLIDTFGIGHDEIDTSIGDGNSGR